MIPNLGALPLCELAPAHHAILIEQELSRRAEKKILERDFAAFAKAAWHVVAPDRELVWNWHHDLICNYLEAFALRYIRNLQINIPPRCTKSILCAVLYPVWVWIKQPNHQFLTLSFKEDLSTRDAVASRNLMASEWFQRRWSDRFKFSGDTNAKTRYQNDHSGHRISSGMTSGVLGDGGDCLPGETRVMTEVGEIRIDTLTQLIDKPRVLSYNHLTEQLEYRPVVAARELPADELIEFKTSSGNTLRTTRRHRLYVHKSGYRPAKNICLGERFLELVPGMPWVQTQGEPVLQPLLSPDEAPGSGDGVLVMWDPGNPGTLGIQEKSRAGWADRILLLCRAFAGASRSQESPEVRGLRIQGSEENQEILLDSLPGVSQKARLGDCLRNLWEAISSGELQGSVLLAGLFGAGPQPAYAGRREYQIPGWEMRPEWVPCDAAGDYGAGWAGLCGLQDAGKLDRASHGPGPEEQSGRESGRSVSALPRQEASLRTSGVRVVARVRHGGEPVYDLQVAGNSNFFANGILSHNSIIIDDPHDPEGAQSDAQRATTLRSYDGQLITRLNDRRSGGILIFMQRLHDHDLCGHVLAREGQADQGGRWHRLVVPMRYDPELSLSTYPEAGKDPRTKPGELLDPIRFPRGEVDLLETTLGPYNVSGQHQQSPSPPGGGILKTAWWQMWPKERPLPKCREIFASLDTAFTERHHKEMEQTGHAARSACTVWGVFEEDNGAPGVMLIGSWADWIDWPALVKKARETYDRHDPDYILIEKKASGISLLQDLKYQGIPVVEYTPDGDKIARAYACQSILSSGFVWYPDRAWAHEVVAECAAFPRGSLKDYPDTCVTPDTEIYCAEGVKPIRDIVPGDWVLTHAGRFRRVTSVMTRTSDHIHRFKAKCLDEISITGNHPMFIQRADGVGWIPVAEVKPREKFQFYRKGKVVSCPVYLKSADFDMAVLPEIRGADGAWSVLVGAFAEEELTGLRAGRKKCEKKFSLNYDQGWLFGLFLAEGCVTKSRGIPSKIVIACNEGAMLKAQSIISSTFGVDVKIRNEGVCHKLVICRKALVPVFETFGHLAENKYIPRWVMEAPISFVKGFVEGYVTGDGTIDHDAIRCSSASRSLLLQLRLLLIRLGKSASLCMEKPAGVRVINGAMCECLPAYSINWVTRDDTTTIGRPLEGGGMGYWVERNDRIEGPVEVMNLSVDEDESYVTTGGTVHNCTQAWLRIKKSGLLRRKVIPFRDPGLDDEEDEPAFVKPKKYRRVVGIYG